MTALMDAVASATAALPRLYKQGQVPDKPTYPYGSWSAYWTTAHGYALDARHGLRRGRIVLQTFARTADAATDLAEQVVRALLDRRLEVDDWADVTPCHIELAPTVVRLSEPENTGLIGVTTVLSLTAIPDPEEES